MITRPLSRRTLLRGLGATMAIPYLEMMNASGATSASYSGAPQRLCCMFQPNGVYPKAWGVLMLERVTANNGFDHGASTVAGSLRFLIQLFKNRSIVIL